MSSFSKSIWAERLCSCRSICVLTREYRATRRRLKCRLAGMTCMMGFLFSSGMICSVYHGSREMDSFLLATRKIEIDLISAYGGDKRPLCVIKWPAYVRFRTATNNLHPPSCRRSAQSIANNPLKRTSAVDCLPVTLFREIAMDVSFSDFCGKSGKPTELPASILHQYYASVSE